MTTGDWDHSSHQEFVEYYERESESAATAERFLVIQAKLLKLAGEKQFDVADIGCGAGAQCQLWARLGHRVRGLDINEPLLQIARRRAADSGLDIAFDLGSATSLPWRTASFDICLMPELLEHVADWQSCLREAARILRTGGFLYLSTTNVLCPFQSEFELPFYSWYPASLKHYFERLAITTRPALANFAKYPAVHWFSFYGLKRFLEPLGFQCFDRFDLIDLEGKSRLAKLLLVMTRQIGALRLLGHVATSSTYLVAAKAAT